nr:ATP-grasp fold amidoligase family protein [Treponema sp. Marseille-Q4132]
MEPKIFYEYFIEAPEKAGLIDYRFMCFNGKVKFLLVDINTMDVEGGHSTNAKRNVYDREFNLLPIKVTRPTFDPCLLQKPINWDRMLEIAEKLSKPFIHCRIDLYNVGGKIYFGEITFHHAGGCNKIEPEEMQLEWGSYIQLPNE